MGVCVCVCVLGAGGGGVYKRHFCIRRRKNALLIAFGVEIVWDNQRMNGSWDAYLGPPADFAGADDVITSLGSRSSNALPNL